MRFLILILVTGALLAGCASKQEPHAWTVESRGQTGKIAYLEVPGSLKKAESLIPCVERQILNDVKAEKTITDHCREKLTASPSLPQRHGLDDIDQYHCQEAFDDRFYRVLTYRCLETSKI